MKTFIPFAEQMKTLLKIIVKTPEWHAKWLNTLSYLENCGARKIASCEHPTLVKEEMLKHASEEFRHAHYLKRQIPRLSLEPLTSYSPSNILGGFSTLHYLTALNLKASQYLKQAGFSKKGIKEAAYLLVTYAIELRAAELYPVYEDMLRKTGSRVHVKSILLEEKEHLNEMKAGLKDLPSGLARAEYICSIESALCNKWLHSIQQSLQKTAALHK